MTEGELKVIEARAALASQGPWMRNGKTQLGWRIDDCEPNKVGMAMLMNPVGIIVSDANADFVAEARNDIPELLAEIRRLKAELVKAREAADRPGEAR